MWIVVVIVVGAGLNHSVRSETAADTAVKTGCDFAVGLIEIPGLLQYVGFYSKSVTGRILTRCIAALCTLPVSS